MPLVDASLLHRELGQPESPWRHGAGADLCARAAGHPALRQRPTSCSCRGGGKNSIRSSNGPVAWRIFELSEPMCRDALAREGVVFLRIGGESSTRRSRVKQRNDAEFAHVAAWRYAGDGVAPVPLREPLDSSTRPCREELSLMRLILQIWRQKNEQATGRLCRYEGQRCHGGDVV